jgi:flagellar hook-associated protein 3
MGRFSDLSNLQQRMSTGKALNRPSDGPVEVANVLKLKTQNVQLKQHETNTYDGLAWMQITDTVMTSMNSTIRRARELAIQGDTDTLGSPEKKFICDEVQQLTLQMVSLMNTRYKGDYIFSGCQTDKATIDLKETKLDPAGNNMIFFDGSAGLGTPIQLLNPNGHSDGSADSDVKRIIPGSLSIGIGSNHMIENVDYTVNYIEGTITLINPLMAVDFAPSVGAGSDYYTGFQIRLTYMDDSKDIYGNPVNTNSKIYRQIDDSSPIAINTTINDLAVSSQTDIFTSLISLGQALIQNDHQGILAAMGGIDASFDKILSAQSTNGSLVNRFDSTLERNEGQQVEVSRLQSQLEDADYAETVTNYMIMQTVFDAALNSVAKIMQTSLANYLR